MRCNSCGIEYPDNYTNCPQCATKNPAYQPAPQKQHPPYKTAIELIREVGRHKLYLPACILTTIGAALTMLSSGIDVLTTLITVAMWLFFAESKKDSDPYKMDLTSLKILKVVKTIELVLCWIAVGLLSIFLPLMGLGVGELASEPLSDAGAILGGVAIFAIILMILCVCSLVPAIIQTSGLRNYYKSALESAETGQRPNKLPKSAPIIMLVLACIGIATNVTIIFSSGLIMDLIKNTAMTTLPFDIISFSGATLAFAGIAGSITYVAQIFIALILLDAKNLADNSYYPNPEEAFYNKQIYYGNTPYFYAPFAAPMQPQYQPPVYQQPQFTEPKASETEPSEVQEAPSEQASNADTNTDITNE